MASIFSTINNLFLCWSENGNTVFHNRTMHLFMNPHFFSHLTLSSDAWCGTATVNGKQPTLTGLSERQTNATAAMLMLWHAEENWTLSQQQALLKPKTSTLLLLANSTSHVTHTYTTVKLPATRRSLQRRQQSSLRMKGNMELRRNIKKVKLKPTKLLCGSAERWRWIGSRKWSLY